MTRRQRNALGFGLLTLGIASILIITAAGSNILLSDGAFVLPTLYGAVVKFAVPPSVVIGAAAYLLTS